MAYAEEDRRRFRLIPFTEMTPEQRKYADAVMAGPTSSTGSAAVVPGASTIGSPFNVYLRSPLLADRLRVVAEYLRFQTSLPFKLNELAILITARKWTAQYEWFAHHRLALKAGLDPAIAEDIAQGRRPAKMAPEEEIVYTFCHELHTTHQVSDAAFNAMKDRFRRAGRGRPRRRERLLRDGIDDPERGPRADPRRRQAAAADPQAAASLAGSSRPRRRRTLSP
jgi:4-carboxymuconolactone decarboxylase